MNIYIYCLYKRKYHIWPIYLVLLRFIVGLRAIAQRSYRRSFAPPPQRVMIVGRVSDVEE